ncbi:hypothetical protein MD484_g1891, partial [Candolleomyces efflorescens]
MQMSFLAGNVAQAMQQQASQAQQQQQQQQQAQDPNIQNNIHLQQQQQQPPLQSTMRLREDPPAITPPARGSKKRKSPPNNPSDAPAQQQQQQPPPPPPQQTLQHVLPPPHGLMHAHAIPGQMPAFPYATVDYTPGGMPPGMAQPQPGAPQQPQQAAPAQARGSADAAAAAAAANGGRALSNSKRAEQNRKAQRAFRERRDQHVKFLESRSQLLDAALQSADEANRRWEECRALVDQLRVENAALRAALSQATLITAGPPPGQTFEEQNKPPGNLETKTDGGAAPAVAAEQKSE